MIAKVLVVCQTHNPRSKECRPDIFICKIECTPKQWREGKHYELAEHKAHENGFYNPMISIDEYDPAKALLKNLKWNTAKTYTVEDSVYNMVGCGE